MKSVWIILALLCCIPEFFLLGSQQVHSGGEVMVAGWVEHLGKDLIDTEWRTSREVLERQPRWDGLSAEPPLRVERACALAREAVREHFPMVTEWRVQSIHMRNLIDKDYSTNRYSSPGVWVYEIRLVPSDRVERDRILETLRSRNLTQVVLQDGTVLRSRSTIVK